MRSALLAMLLALSASSSAAAASSASGAVAVMPFKNLAGTSELDWLKLGISETLLADLAKDGGRPVVERSQIDRALAEVMLQKENATASEDGMAARAGKLVGATTVVVGGFQQQGKELRITARFVNVESGVVEETAKVTGALDNVFALQDQIVAKLLKKPQKARAKKKATPQKEVEAYQAYSLSLATSSDVERIRYLRESIGSDPEFVYALDDLKALEQRLNRYRENAGQIADERARAALAVAKDTGKTVDERTQAVMQILSQYASTFRYRALLDFSSVVKTLELPSSGFVDVNEQASFYIFLAHLMLKQSNLALESGEAHLKRWPGSALSGSVEMQLRNHIEDRRRLVDANADAQTELQKIDSEEKEFAERQREDALKGRKAAPPERTAMFGFRRCTTVYRGRLYEDAVTRCNNWAAEHPASDDQHLDELARYFAGLSQAELGRFAEARQVLTTLQAEDATWARSMGIPSILTTWPRD